MVIIGVGVSCQDFRAVSTGYSAKFVLGQVGRSLGPLLFCTLYWWAGRDLAYKVGGAGMLGVCALVFGGLKAPSKSLAAKVE